MISTGDKDRFHELAHKALAKEASPAEQRELRGLIAEKPELKREMECLGGEVAVAREILEMIEDLQHPVENVPQPPMAKLSREVGEVFNARKKSKAELRELLDRLGDWARRQKGAGREEVTALAALLRGSLLEREGEATLADAALLHAPEIAYAAPRLREEIAGRARSEVASRQEELVKRLLRLEQRLNQAEAVAQECREEVRGLLDSIAREQEGGAERRGRNPNPMKKPQD